MIAMSASAGMITSAPYNHLDNPGNPPTTSVKN